MKLGFLGCLVCIFYSLESSGAQVVSELEHVACEEFRLSRELIIYKDPSLFIGNLGQMYNNPSQGWASLMNESPILTTVQGTIHLMKLGLPIEFKSFGVISKLYELVDPRFKLKIISPQNKIAKPLESLRPLVVPVKVCGQSYADSLGFIIVSDLDWAQEEDLQPGTLPPSIYPNPIPNLKKH